MSPSKVTIAFFLILAAVAATLHPSSAARVQLAEEEAAPQPPFFWRPRVPLPPLPPLPSFPCIPGLPRPRFLPPCDGSSPSSGGGATPAAPAPPQPAECGTSVSPLTACADFLTFNATAGRRSLPAPPAAACCDAVKALVKDAPVCLCHVVNGDLAKLLPAPMLRLRAMALPRVCGAAVPFGTFSQCIRGPVPPMDAAPAPPS
ncbi:unnamed protein product [Urochloa humidicola]